MPGALATLVGVDRVEADPLLDDLLLHLARQLVPDLVGGQRRVQQERRARRGVLEHVDLVDELELVAGDEAGAWCTRYAERIGRGLERRCETVIAPDFFES